MTHLPDLTGAAISGSPDALPPTAVVQAALAATPAGASPARRLLDAAGVVGIVRRALLPTQPTATLPPAPDPAPDVVEQVLSPDAAVTLRSYLAQPDLPTLHEWLEHVRAAGRVTPPELVPAVLRAAAATRWREARHGYVAILGTRGRWFAAQHDEWRHLVVELPRADDGTVDVDALADAPAWRDTTPDARTDWFDLVRAAAPDAARSLLLRDGATIDPASLTGCLGVLGLRLTLADEPVLEEAAAHRSRSVAETARQLLERLPGSAARARLAATLGDAVTITRGRLLGRTQMTVDDALAPDALAAAVGANPLTRWTDTGLGPAELIDLALAAGDRAAPVLDGWLRTTIDEGNSTWADAFLAAPAAGDPMTVIEVATRPALVAFWTRVGRAAFTSTEGVWPFMSMLGELEGTVPVEVTLTLLELAARSAETIGVDNVRGVVQRLAVRSEPTVRVRDAFTAAAQRITAPDDVRTDLEEAFRSASADIHTRLTQAQELT